MSKKNDQTIKADAGKLQLTLVPPEIIYAIARIREYGCKKYPEGGKDNWKRVEPQRYFEALARHVLAAWDDYTKTDTESGYMHLEHAACNMAFLLQLISEGKGNDGSGQQL